MDERFGVKEFTPTIVAVLTALRAGDSEQAAGLLNELDRVELSALAVSVSAMFSTCLDALCSVAGRDPDEMLSQLAVSAQLGEDG